MPATLPVSDGGVVEVLADHSASTDDRYCWQVRCPWPCPSGVELSVSCSVPADPLSARVLVQEALQQAFSGHCAEVHEGRHARIVVQWPDAVQGVTGPRCVGAGRGGGRGYGLRCE